MASLEINNLGIPPLAGLCTYEEACNPGYSVDHTVALLKRYNYVETRLNEIFTAHLAHTPEWEVKCAFSLHLWLDAEHSEALRKRVTEMREPPHHLDDAPDEKLRALFDELIRADSTLELLTGVYRVMKPELIRSLREYQAQANRLVDYPTRRVLASILQEEEEMVAWGEKALAALTQTIEDAQTVQAWEKHLEWFLYNAGGISGTLTLARGLTPPTPRSDGSPYIMTGTPRRDQRFVDPFNRSAKIDEYYQDESRGYDERVSALLYKRLREMDVPEWMAPIIYKTRGKPWEYYRDMSRQLWDEARHAMIGEVGLYAKGVPFYRYPIDLKSSMSLNDDFKPIEAHLILWGIEQSLMPRETGKRWEWEIAMESHDKLAAMFQDYDWADEVLHAQIGRKWLIPEFGTRSNMLSTWEELWQRWLAAMEPLAARSKQEEWWPDFIAEVRRNTSSEALSSARNKSATRV